MKNNLPSLYGAKGDELTLIKQIELTLDNELIIIEIGAVFKIENIIGYGFDLIRIDGNPIEIRILNSEMSEFFGDKNT